MTPRAMTLTALFCLVLALVARGAPPVGAQDAGFATTLAASPSTVPPGYTVDFAYTGTPSPNTPPETSITSATIDFGDGQTFSAGSAGPGQPVGGTAAHVYKASGTYTAIFKALGSDGEIGTAATVITVSSQLTPPAVMLHLDSSTAQTGDNVSITYSITPGSVADASLVSMAISYGDGQSDQLTTPSGTVSHSYGSAGTFPILIVATDSSGQAAAASTTIQVSAP
jgi:large repetitive protein